MGEPAGLRVPIEIRYADIDSLQHVNNARYFTFMEQARAYYFKELGLWRGQSMSSLGVILAHTSCDFLRPIRFSDQVWVETSTVKLGGKSFDMRYDIMNEADEPYARGKATLVCYSYDEEKAIPMPADWRQRLAEFESLQTEE
jgi:acyl-CoA thioester hydrolase